MEKFKTNKLFSSLFSLTTLAVVVLAVQFATFASDSLWKDPHARAMFADKKAHAVGDILTVVIQENNGASRQNTTSTSKKVSQAAGITSFLYGPANSGLLTRGGQYPAMNYNSANTFDGGGTINNQETITANLSVRVIDVLPNGNLVIEGRRQTEFSGEKQDAILRGTVRYDDISATNSIASTSIADATIQFIGKGTVSDNQRKGWFTKVWDKLSPF